MRLELDFKSRDPVVDATLTIGEVAARAGVNTSHIRYYERVGVLPQPERTSGRRRYGEDVLHRLAIIDVAQRAGFTLDEIRHLTGPANQGALAGNRIRDLAERKLPAIETLIARAEAMKAWLDVATTCDCETVDVCSLFTDPALAPPPGGQRLHSTA
jgi:MerR family redox-sensitive transcriptional activator SoxR